jgi:hypothetical protein
MVRVFKEDIQKRKDDSDRKNGKGGSGKPISSIFTLSTRLHDFLFHLMLPAGSATPFLHTQSI